MKKVAFVLLILFYINCNSQKNLKPSKQETISWITNKLNKHAKSISSILIYSTKNSDYYFSIQNDVLVIKYKEIYDKVISKDYEPRKTVKDSFYITANVPIIDIISINCNEINAYTNISNEYSSTLNHIFIITKTNAILVKTSNGASYNTSEIYLPIKCNDEENLTARLKKSFITLKSYISQPLKPKETF